MAHPKYSQSWRNLPKQTKKEQTAKTIIKELFLIALMVGTIEIIGFFLYLWRIGEILQ